MRSKTRATAAKTKMNTIGEDDLSAPMHLTSQADADEAFGGAMTGVLSSSAALDVVGPSQALSELDFVHEPAQSQLRTYAGRKKTRSARSGPAVDVTDNRPEEHLTKGKTTAPQAQSDVGVPGTADGEVNNDSDVPTAPDEDNNSEEEEEDVVTHSIRMAKEERLEQQRHRAYRHFVFSGERIEVEPFISHAPIRLNTAYVDIPPRPSPRFPKSKGKEREIQEDAHDGNASEDDNSSQLGDHQQSPGHEGTGSNVDYDAEAMRLSTTRNNFGKYVHSVSNKEKAPIPGHGSPLLESDLTGSSWSEDEKLRKARRANRHHRPESDTEEEDARADDEELAKPDRRSLPELRPVRTQTTRLRRSQSRELFLIELGKIHTHPETMTW